MVRVFSALCYLPAVVICFACDVVAYFLVCLLYNMDSIAAIDKQKDVDTYKAYNYEYTLLKAFDNKAASDARNAGGGAESTLTKSFAFGASARKLTAFGGSMRQMNMKKSRAQSVYIRGI